MRAIAGRSLAALACAALLCAARTTWAVDLTIVTGPERSTAFAMGRDLARFVAPDAGIRLRVLPTAGSVEDLPRLRTEPGVKFAIAQADVFQAFLDQAAQGDRAAAATVGRLRVVAPLHEEEVYFVVRADSPWKTIDEIRDARIDVGPVGSGSAVTGTQIYRRMFGAPMPSGHATFLPPDDALARLVDDRSVDVVVVVAGQPARLFARMRPGARKLIRLLAFDPARAASRAAIGPYRAATIRASSYPNLLDADVPALSVRFYLLTYDFDRAETIGLLVKFARSLCANAGRLREQGDPAWRDVKLSEKDAVAGWRYYPRMTQVLDSCAAPVPRARGTATPPNPN